VLALHDSIIKVIREIVTDLKLTMEKTRPNLNLPRSGRLLRSETSKRRSAKFSSSERMLSSSPCSGSASAPELASASMSSGAPRESFLEDHDGEEEAAHATAARKTRFSTVSTIHTLTDEEEEEEEEELDEEQFVQDGRSSNSSSLQQEQTKSSEDDEDAEDERRVMTDVFQGRLDRYGFATLDSNDLQRSRQTYVSKVETNRQRRRRVRLENLRTEKWLAMLGAWDVQSKKKRKRLDSRIRKGVPDGLRDKVWPRLVELNQTILTEPAFEDLLEKTNLSFDAEIDKTRECISRDIGRTFPRHVVFQKRNGVGQQSLTNVLRAYASLDPEVGYCQGMGFIVGLLLGYLPEHKTFQIFRTLMLEYPWRLCELFKPGMPGAQQMLSEFEQLLEKHVPKLAKHLENEMIVPSMYATHWFITVFTYNFPFDVVVRVWDVFLAEGWTIVFQTAVAILKINSKALSKHKFEQILEYFKGIPAALDPDELMKVALSLPISIKK